MAFGNSRRKATITTTEYTEILQRLRLIRGNIQAGFIARALNEAGKLQDYLRDIFYAEDDGDARSNQRRTGAVRRRMIWAREAQSFASGTVAHDLLADFREDNGGGNLLGVTITRIRLNVHILWDGTPAVGNWVYSGIYVDHQNHTAGEVSGPLSDQHEDWMAYNMLSRAGDGEVSVGTTGHLTHHVIDVKSQRKLDELGDTLWFVTTEGGTGLQATGMNIVSSVLVKLP